MVHQLVVVALVLVTVFVASGVYAQDYLSECVNAYESIIKSDCDYHGHACFNDETREEFGHNPSAATIRIALESCETALNPAVLKERYCCADDECFKQCKSRRARKSLRPHRVQRDSASKTE
uniref:Conserved secreted protein n=1 Tax=Panagrellus redivivus TaxID=6233 RepID=A0A7E4VMK6_PANRE